MVFHTTSLELDKPICIQYLHPEDWLGQRGRDDGPLPRNSSAGTDKERVWQRPWPRLWCSQLHPLGWQRALAAMASSWHRYGHMIGTWLAHDWGMIGVIATYCNILQHIATVIPFFNLIVRSGTTKWVLWTGQLRTSGSVQGLQHICRSYFMLVPYQRQMPQMPSSLLWQCSLLGRFWKCCFIAFHSAGPLRVGRIEVRQWTMLAGHPASESLNFVHRLRFCLASL